MIDILIQHISENVTSGTVIDIKVKVGDPVTKDQTLLELETEKAVLEIPSSVEGTMAEILIHKGDTVKVGQIAFRVSSEAIPGPLTPPTLPNNTVENPPPLSAPPLAQKKAETTPDLPPVAVSSVRRFAREIGVDLEKVTGTEPHGRISIEDVQAYAKATLTGGANPSLPPSASVEALPDFSKWGEIVVEPMSSIRQKIAEHTAKSWASIPHVTHFAKADITELEKLRLKYSANDRKLSVLPFVMKVVAGALKNFPRVNASINVKTNELILKKYYNIGIAVDTEHGLLVPVIRDVDKKSILELADELKLVSERARNRKLLPQDMQGGTFTMTNLGSITGGLFTPIINTPEVAILGLSRAELEPCFNNGPLCAPRLMLPLCLSYDHRVIDGADGARFIQWIADAVQQPFMIELK